MKVGKSWPDNTFVWEDGNREHYCGTHWKPFFGNPEEIFEELPEIIPTLAFGETFGDIYAGPHKIPPDWAKGHHLYWPNWNRGLVATLLISGDEPELMNISPYAGVGIQTCIEIEKVHVWASGTEAQIEGLWGESPVSFFDLHFLGNRAWYEAGKRREFVLAGIAYGAYVSRIGTLGVTPESRSAVSRRIRVRPTVGNGAHIGLEGSSIFIPITDRDRDDYRFRGPVRKVTAFHDWLGQSGWTATVGIMEFEGKSLDLDIFITERAWGGGKPPRAGQDIEGSLWLQGRLWYAV